MSNGELLISRLTQREREILSMIVRGYSNMEIAHSVGIAPSTAKIHRANIYQKFSVGSLKDLFEIFEVRSAVIEI